MEIFHEAIYWISKKSGMVDIVKLDGKVSLQYMECEKMNLSKIHHIAIIVSDYEVAKDFYVNKLGGSFLCHQRKLPPRA